MKVVSNEEGILWQPSQLLKQIFGENQMSDVYYARNDGKKSNSHVTSSSKPEKAVKDSTRFSINKEK